MKTHYVLIDYENVQPKNLAILNGHSVKVVVFVGATQKKIPADYPASLRAQGVDAEKIKIAGSGPNALDFHIAFYIGQFSAHSTNTHFHIISNDKGFDPLVRHLKGKKINVRRRGDLAKMTLPKLTKTTKTKSETAETKSLEEKVNFIVDNFAARGRSCPGNVKTLKSTINTLFPNKRFPSKLTQAELKRLIDELCVRKIVAIDNDNISYGPPITQS